MSKDIELKEEALTQDDDFSTALGDRFSYHVFSDDFIYYEEQKKQEEEEKEETTLDTVLNGTEIKDPNQEYFQIVMQSDPIQVIKDNGEEQPHAVAAALQNIIPFFVGILLVTAVFMLIKRRKKQ